MGMIYVMRAKQDAATGLWRNEANEQRRVDFIPEGYFIMAYVSCDPVTGRESAYYTAAPVRSGSFANPDGSAQTFDTIAEALEAIRAVEWLNRQMARTEDATGITN